MKVLFLIANILKLALWVYLCGQLVHELGPILGGLLFAVFFCITWNLIWTLILAKWKGNDWKFLLKVIFTTKVKITYANGTEKEKWDWSLPLTVWGAFCSPHFGGDGPTFGMKPVDGQDENGFYHDQDMAFSKLPENAENIKQLKNAGDEQFFKSTATTISWVNPVWWAMTEAGFLFRILGRSVVK